MIDTPVFAQSAKTATAVCTAAKTTYNDTNNAVLLLTAGLGGALVTTLTAVPRATVSATQLQLYSSPDSGATLNLIDSVSMGAYTMVQTIAVPVTAFSLISPSAPLLLAPSERLYVAAGVALAGGIVFRAAYGEL